VGLRLDGLNLTHSESPAAFPGLAGIQVRAAQDAVGESENGAKRGCAFKPVIAGLFNYPPL